MLIDFAISEDRGFCCNLLRVWVNTYRYIFSGMNIHLPAILGFTRYQGFDPSPYISLGQLNKNQTNPNEWVMLCTGNELHTLYNYVDLRRAMLLRCIVGSCERLRGKQKGLCIYIYI